MFIPTSNTLPLLQRLKCFFIANNFEFVWNQNKDNIDKKWRSKNISFSYFLIRSIFMPDSNIQEKLLKCIYTYFITGKCLHYFSFATKKPYENYPYQKFIVE